LLSQHDIRLIGVGLEELGVEDFVKGEYWDGELYVDINQESYKALGYRRFNFCSIWMSVFAKKGRDAISKVQFLIAHNLLRLVVKN
jgi:prostamide/prostaglandin F2alpha synthase